MVSFVLLYSTNSNEWNLQRGISGPDARMQQQRVTAVAGHASRLLEASASVNDRPNLF
jgi:hypothetical protein